MCLCERLCHNEVDEQTLVSCQLLSWSNPSVSLFVATFCISELSKLDLFTKTSMRDHMAVGRGLSARCTLKLILR